MKKVNFFQEIRTWVYDLLHIFRKNQLLHMQCKFVIHNVTYQPDQIFTDSCLFPRVHTKTYAYCKNERRRMKNIFLTNIVLLW